MAYAQSLHQTVIGLIFGRKKGVTHMSTGGGYGTTTTIVIVLFILLVIVLRAY
jgi:uncharacterized protein (TIGR01732 family)